MSNPENISKNVKVTMVQAPVADGTASVGAGNLVDMQNFDSVMFLGIVGTQSATDVSTLKVQTAAATSGAWSDFTGATIASTAGGDDGFFGIDVPRPQARYVRSFLTNDTGTEYGGTLAIQYGARKMPTTHGTSTQISTGNALPIVLSVKQTTSDA